MSAKDPYALGFEIVNKKDKAPHSAILNFESPHHLFTVVTRSTRDFDMSRLKPEAFEWFKDKEPALYGPDTHHVERQVRLRWLAEGSMAYHLSKFQTEAPPVVSELLMFMNFVNSNPPMKAKRKPYPPHARTPETDT